MRVGFLVVLVRGLGWALAVFVASMSLFRSAHASGTVPMGPATYEYQVNNAGYFADLSAACAAAADARTAASSTTNYEVTACATGANGVSMRGCSRTTGSCAGTTTYTATRRTLAAQCPGGSTPATASTCTCTDPLIAKDGQCVAPCEATVGKPVGSGSMVVQSGASPQRPGGVCSGGCMFAIASVDMSGSQGGKWFHWFNAAETTGTGTACTPSPDGGSGPAEPDKPTPLPPGKCPGEVNGVAVVVGCDTTKAPGSSSSGSSSSTPPGGAPSAGPSTTEQSETTCKGSTCTTTTTTTTTNPDGSKSETTKDESESKDSFCAENPGSPMCEKSSWGGSCGGFSCGGDAVQCAMARDQHQRNCALFDTATPMSDLGIASANGQARPDGHPGNSSSVTNLQLSGMLSSTPLFGANGSCPADVTVGRWVIAFSKMCPMLNVLGVALEAFAYLVACFIVFRKGV